MTHNPKSASAKCDHPAFAACWFTGALILQSSAMAGSHSYLRPGAAVCLSGVRPKRRRYQAGLRLGAEVSTRCQATALIVPNAFTAPAFVHAKSFAFARVKHNLNDLGPIAAANAPELFLGLFAAQSMSAEEVHVMLQGHQSGRWTLVPQNWLNSEYFVA